MTWKLMKFEFRSSFRILLVLWAAFMAVTVIICVTGTVTGFEEAVTGTYYANGNLREIIEFVSLMTYFAVLVAIVVLTVAVIIVRFYRGLLGDEGYLMHTLPVKEWQLIAAKGMTATCAVIGSSIVTILSFVIILTVGVEMNLSEIIRDIADSILYNPTYILLFVEMLIVMILGIMKSVYQIYAALSIGQLMNRHRIIASLGAYIGISIVLTIIVDIIVVLFNELGGDIFLSSWLSTLSFSTAEGITQAGQLVFLFLVVITGIQLVAFHIVTERILTKKLNLL